MSDEALEMSDEALGRVSRRRRLGHQFLDTRDKFPDTRDLGVWKRGPRGLETRDRGLENA